MSRCAPFRGHWETTFCFFGFAPLASLLALGLSWAFGQVLVGRGDTVLWVGQGSGVAQSGVVLIDHNVLMTVIAVLADRPQYLPLLAMFSR